MPIVVDRQPAKGALPAVDYRWDADTDIFTATLSSRGGTAEPAGSVEIEGTDGSWLVLELRGGLIVGVEVALWPDVRCNPGLAAPRSVESASVFVKRAPVSGPATLEVEAAIHAETDEAERVVYFRIGGRREVISVRVGSDLLLDVDPQGRLAGLWLLNVPPFPVTIPP